MRSKKYKSVDFWKRFIKKDFDKLTKLFAGFDYLSEEEKKVLFKEFVEVINIETSSYCNRACIYCPLHYYNRGKRKEYINKEVFQKIINELKRIDFDGTFILNLYNEPLLDENLPSTVSYIRSELPESYILFNSNGDYLSREMLTTLSRSGVDNIVVTLHSSKPLSEQDAVGSIEMYYKKLGIKDFSFVTYAPDKCISATANFDSLIIDVFCKNLVSKGNNRAGSVLLDSLNKKDFMRKSPCIRPFRELTISYTADTYLCCNIFPDNPRSKELMLGNLNYVSIYDVFFSNTMAYFRSRLIDFSTKVIYPCDSCNDCLEDKDTFPIINDNNYKRLLEFLKIARDSDIRESSREKDAAFLREQ